MGIFDVFRRGPTEGRAQAGTVQAHGDVAIFDGLTDPYLQQFVRSGSETSSGAVVTVEAAMKNTAVLRCVSLISGAVGMLPLHLYEADGDKQKASDHPLFELIYRQPNGWQSAFDFRSLMQAWALMHGDAFALIVRRGRDVIRLVPLDPRRVTVEQNDTFDVEYTWRRKDGGSTTLRPDEVFHLRGFSLDGLRGISTVRQAAEAIGLSLQAQRAAAKIFRNGMLTGGALTLPPGAKLSQAALERLKADMRERYETVDNAGRWMVLEEGMQAAPIAANAKDNQHLEMRKHQIEEIARAFGVPRPFLMLDDTSWGTGIEVLSQAFVRNCLAPWFAAWEQAISMRLLRRDERESYYAKFNAGALERGNLKDQGDFFAKALGAGGHAPWMHQDEVRELMELGPRDDLPPAAGAAGASEQSTGTTDDETSDAED